MSDIAKVLDEVVETIGPVIRESIAAAIAPLVARLDKLEAQQAAWKYVGVWSAEREYQANNWTTHDGSVWHALRDSKGARPGDGGDSWKLAVRRGQDGKDARR
jgi:hypothetical protein